jgi:hypothetical protein
MRTPRNDRLSDKDDATQTGRDKTPGRDAKSGKRQTLRDTQRKEADGATGPNAVASSRVSMMHAMG